MIELFNIITIIYFIEIFHFIYFHISAQPQFENISSSKSRHSGSYRATLSQSFGILAPSVNFAGRIFATARSFTPNYKGWKNIYFPESVFTDVINLKVFSAINRQRTKQKHRVYCSPTLGLV